MEHFKILEYSLQEENIQVQKREQVLRSLFYIDNGHNLSMCLSFFSISSGLDDSRNTAQLAARMMRDGCVMKITRSLERVSGFRPTHPSS